MSHGRLFIVACSVLIVSAAESPADVPVRILTRDGAWTDGRLQNADAEAWTIESTNPVRMSPLRRSRVSASRRLPGTVAPRRRIDAMSSSAIGTAPIQR